MMEGPVCQGDPVFVAWHRLPLRHGMTLGELARLFVAERHLQVRLTVVPVENWRRRDWFDATGQPWRNPSPNMRSLNAAILYPGIGLHESALSVGRGTETPFEIVGAPYIDDLALAAELNRADLPGIRFVPIRFTPRASTFAERECGGVSLVITDRQRLRPVELGIQIALTLQQRYPREFALDKLQPLLRDTNTLEGIRAGIPLSRLRQSWAADLEQFQARRAPFLLYR
jgi:uncharacterized protein YbbC (DUF1343 family)